MFKFSFLTAQVHFSVVISVCQRRVFAKGVGITGYPGRTFKE